METTIINTWSEDEQPKPQCILLSCVRQSSEDLTDSAFETVADPPDPSFEPSALGQASMISLRKPTTSR